LPATELSVDALRARVATVLGRRRKALTLEGRIRAAVLVLFVYRAGVPALVFGVYNYWTDRPAKELFQRSGK